jgi:hypothetical protein
LCEQEDLRLFDLQQRRVECTLDLDKRGLSIDGLPRRAGGLQNGTDENVPIPDKVHRGAPPVQDGGPDWGLSTGVQRVRYAVAVTVSIGQRSSYLRIRESRRFGPSDVGRRKSRADEDQNDDEASQRMSPACN